MFSPFFENTAIQKFIDTLTLRKILVAAIFMRLLAAFFSIGYGMHDDHFNVIEVAQSWADGGNVGGWLPDVPEGAQPDVSHSLFYPGVHAVLFKLTNVVGLNDPQLKMLLVRVLHAFYSLFIVYFCYKITEKIADGTAAKWSALFVALLWFMPNLSVRNLVEIVCIPPLLAGVWYLIKNDRYSWKNYLLSGFIIGFAFSIRYQTALFIGGVGLVLLIQKQWKGFAVYSIGVLVNIFLFQCVSDIVLWGYPLAEFYGYVQYNIVHKGDYFTGHWFNYLLVVSGLVLPPFSVLLWFGYFKNVKANLLLFLPSFIFLAFHSYFENKQERFILPFVPFFIILGIAGWQNTATRFFYPSARKKAVNAVALTVMSLNLILLLVASVASSKTSRMNAMYYLYKQHDAKGYIYESSYVWGWQFFPRFYAGSWLNEYQVTNDYHAESLRKDLSTAAVKPNYAIFLSDKDIDARIARFKQAYPEIEFKTIIEPAFMDWLFNKLNPVNKYEPCYIYKINYR